MKKMVMAIYNVYNTDKTYVTNEEVKWYNSEEEAYADAEEIKYNSWNHVRLAKLYEADKDEFDRIEALKAEVAKAEAEFNNNRKER